MERPNDITAKWVVAALVAWLIPTLLIALEVFSRAV